MNDASSEPSADDRAGALNAHMLAARIAPPSFEFRPIATRALSALLQAASLPKLITVCAAPGYGKTVMLSRLCESLAQRSQQCLWLTLDDRDADLSTLLFLLRAAMIQAGLLGNTELDTRPTPFADRGATADQLVARLGQAPRTTVLFIDNLGYCRDPQLPAFLDRLVFGTGPGLRLVLSSTREIPVDAVRAKLEGGAVELGAAQLSFDRLSTERLLKEAGLDVQGSEVIDRIQAQTEGWPTAVRLLQVLMSSEQDSPAPDELSQPACALERFTGDHSDIARLLTRRVLVGFDPDLVQFMIEIALVREFSTELAAQMTERQEASAWLQTLVTRNVLIFPLDRSRRWFRFHTLLRDFLLAEGRERLSPQRRRDVLERAARWHALQGDEVIAIGIALDAQAVELSQDLLDRVSVLVAGDQGRMVPYIQWVDRLYAIGGTPSIEAHGWYVWALCNSLQYERARGALDSFDARMDSGMVTAANGRARQLRQGFLRIVVNLYLDRFEETHTGALQWLAEDGPRDALSHAVVAGIAALSEIDRGELPEARAHMELCEGVVERSGSTWVRAWVAILWSCLDLAEARPASADQRLSEVREFVVAALGADAHVLATIDFVRARTLLDLGRTDQAREYAVRGLNRAIHHGILLTTELGLSTCTALWAGESDGELAPSATEKVGHSYPTRLHRLLTASRIRRCLQLGRHEEAQKLAQRCQLGLDPPHQPDSKLPFQRGDWLLASIELKISMGQHDEALALIDRHMRLAQAQERQRDRIELLLASVEIHVRQQHLNKAQRCLSQALIAAAPGRLFHPFQSRMVWLTPLLEQYQAKDFGLTQQAELVLWNRLQDTMASANPAGKPIEEGASHLLNFETPSVRELQLLSLLDRGLSNQQVADQLSLSLPTVKWHLRNLYAKLGVGSRSAALAKARSLSLFLRA